MHLRHLRLRTVLGVLLVGGLGVVAVRLAPPGSGVASWWPAAGVSAVLCLRRAGAARYRMAAVLAVVAGVSNLVVGRPPLVAGLYAVSNSIEVLVVAAILSPRAELRELRSTSAVGRLLLAALAGPLVLGVLVSDTVVVLLHGEFWATFRTVAPSHAAAILGIVPLALTRPGARPEISRWQLVAQPVLLTVTVGIAFGPEHALPLAWLPFAVLAWSAMAFGPWLTQLEILLVTAAEVVLSAYGHGPFTATVHGPQTSANLVQAWVIVSVIMMLTFAVVSEANREATHHVLVNEHLVRRTLDRAPTGIAVVTPQPDGGFVTLWKNPTAERLLRDADIGILLDVLSIGGVDENETITTAGPDGSVLESSLHLLGDGVDGTHRLALHVVDMSAAASIQSSLERALEYERAAVAGLEKADEMKDVLISSVSHELRTPLAGIAGYIEMLQDGDAGALNEEQRRMIDIVDESATRLSTIVGELLDVARLEKGGTTDLRPVAAGAVCERVLAEIAPLLAARGQRLQLQDLTSASALTTEDDLHRIVLNLVTNASKFSPDGGRIDVRVTSSGDAVSVTVDDEGPGLTEEERRRVFDRFYRAPGTSAQAPGTGLGLAVVKMLAERAGGSARVDAASSGGCRFTVRLSVAEAVDEGALRGAAAGAR